MICTTALDYQRIADESAVRAFEANYESPLVEDVQDLICVSFTLPADHEDFAEWLQKELKAAGCTVLWHTIYPPMGKRAERHGHALLLETEDRETVEVLVENAMFRSEELTDVGRTYWRGWADLELDGFWDRKVLGGPTSKFDSRHWALGDVLMTLPPGVYERLKDCSIIWSVPADDAPAPDRGPVLHLPARIAHESIDLVIGVAAYALSKVMFGTDHETAMTEIRRWGYTFEAALLEERLCEQPDFLR